MARCSRWGWKRLADGQGETYLGRTGLPLPFGGA